MKMRSMLRQQERLADCMLLHNTIAKKKRLSKLVNKARSMLYDIISLNYNKSCEVLSIS